MRSTLNGCCLDCPDRHPACHSTCERYKAAREEWDLKKQHIRNSREKYRNYFDFKADNIQKTLRIKRNSK